MRKCPFCNSLEWRTIEVQDSWTEAKNYRVVCEMCDSMGPTSDSPEEAEANWEGALKEEAVGGVSAPMSTVNNTPGMGNATPASTTNIGSGDRWDGSVGKTMYTQESLMEAEGLWDYTVDEAATEIWAVMKPVVQKMIRQAKRTGQTYRLDPRKITLKGCEELAFEPDSQTLIELIIFVKAEINNAIENGELTLNDNVKYMKESLNEGNINPYDKIGMMMAKKMGIKPPFKAIDDPENQNAIEQEKFEHEILTLDEFSNELKKLNEKVK